MRLGLRIIPKGVWVGLRQLSCLLRASLWDLLLHRWNQRKTNIRQPERGHYSHKMATRSLRGNRECGQGYSTLVWFCCGEVLWSFCVGADESQIFFFFLNIIWQQVHPLLHSFPFWVKAHTLNNGTKQRVETNSRNQRHSELEDSLRDLLERLQNIPTWCHAALGTLVHGPRKRKGGRGVLLPYMLTGMGGYYENRKTLAYFP